MGGRAEQSRRKKNMVIAVAVKRPEGRGAGMISSADVGAKLKGTSVANETARTCARARSTEEFA